MELEKMTRWGFSSAPWIDGDHILLHTNRAVAIDRNTGSMVWRSEKSPMPGYSSLALFTHNKKRYLSAMTGNSVVIFERDGGATVASYPFKIEYNLHCITPMAVKESDGSTSIFIAASNKGGRCEKLRFDGKSLKRVYQNEVMRNFMNNSVLIDGYLYGVDGKHKKRTTKFVCMRYSDGKMMWEHKGLGCGSVISANGKLIILSEDGRLVTAEASPKGFAKISEAKILEGTCWTPPSLANGLIYARNQEGQAVCVDLRGK
jgi:outer membrane protein assembly factor BamB